MLQVAKLLQAESAFERIRAQYAPRLTKLPGTNAREHGLKIQRRKSRVSLAGLSHSLSFRQARAAVLMAFSLGVVFRIFQISSDLHGDRDRTDASFQRILPVA